MKLLMWTYLKAALLTLYLVVIQLLYYVYAIVGMELFKGRITYYGYTNLTEETNYCGDVRLNGSEFFIKKYCKTNFNNIFHAYVVLYTLMIVNQWHDILFCAGHLLVNARCSICLLL